MTCLYVLTCLVLSRPFSKQEQFSSPAHSQGSPSQSGSAQRPSTRNSNTRRLGTPLGLGSNWKLTTVNEYNRGTHSNRAGDSIKGNRIDKDTLEPPAGAGAAFNRERSTSMDVDLPRQTPQSSGLSPHVRLYFSALSLHSFALSAGTCVRVAIPVCWVLVWWVSSLTIICGHISLSSASDHHHMSQGSQEEDHEEEEEGTETPNRDSNGDTDTSQTSSVYFFNFSVHCTPMCNARD